VPSDGVYSLEGPGSCGAFGSCTVHSASEFDAFAEVDLVAFAYRTTPGETVILEDLIWRSQLVFESDASSGYPVKSFGAWIPLPSTKCFKAQKGEWIGYQILLDGFTWAASGSVDQIPLPVLA
jgi:hypothetical protein